VLSLELEWYNYFRRIYAAHECGFSCFMAAIDENILRTRFGFNDINVIRGILSDPTQRVRYEKEYEGILHPGQPAPAVSAPVIDTQKQEREALNQKLREEEQGFLTKFRTEYPTVLSSLESTLGLPQLRETAFGAVQDIKGLPEEIRVASQGRDVSANQLNRMISARSAERLPEVNDLLAALQFKEEEYGRQAQRAMTPYETEIGFMKDRASRESTGFSQDSQRELDLLLTQIQEEGATNRATLDRATQLAQLEQQKYEYESSLREINLGNKVILVDSKGNMISSFPAAKLSTLSGPYNPLGLT